MTKEENKDLAYWKANAEEDYMQVPISVLRYITELEKVVKNCSIPAVVGQNEQFVCDSGLLSCYHCKGTGKTHYDNGTWQVCYTCGGSGTR